MIRPVLLTVPGLRGSGPDHWQTRWERERDDCRRIELGDWDDPNPRAWMSRIDQGVTAARGPVVLVGHSLGCHAIVRWGALMGPSGASTVLAALLVAPPATDGPDADPRLARFAGGPRASTPFISLVIASDDDPYATLDESRAIARRWGAGLVEAGPAGHLNAASGLGAWPEGQAVAELLRDTRSGDVRNLALQARALLAGDPPGASLPVDRPVGTVPARDAGPIIHP